MQYDPTVFFLRNYEELNREIMLKEKKGGEEGVDSAEFFCGYRESIEGLVPKGGREIKRTESL